MLNRTIEHCGGHSVDVHIDGTTLIINKVLKHLMIVDSHNLINGMNNTAAILGNDDREEIELRVIMISIEHAVGLGGVVDFLKGLSEPLEGHIGSTDAGQLTRSIVNGLDKSGVMAADIGTIVIVIRIGPEALAEVLGALIPFTLGIVVAG